MNYGETKQAVFQPGPSVVFSDEVGASPFEEFKKANDVRVGKCRSDGWELRGPEESKKCVQGRTVETPGKSPSHKGTDECSNC